MGLRITNGKPEIEKLADELDDLKIKIQRAMEEEGIDEDSIIEVSGLIEDAIDVIFE